MSTTSIEQTPICISLGHIAKSFKKKDQKLGKTDDFDKTLLGKDAYEDFYKTANSNQRDTSYYKRSQGYTAAERIYKLYFDEIGSKYEKRIELKNHIYDTWISRLKEGIPNYEGKINEFLKDAVLLTSEEKAVINYRQYLTKFAKATKTEERADFLTVLTLLSITRTYWGKINPNDILPETSDKGPTITVEIDDFTQINDLFTKKKYAEAIEKLDNLIKHKAKDDTAESLTLQNQTNGRAYYLISKAYRELRNTPDQDPLLFQNYTNDIRNSLNGAAEYHHIPAMLEIARDYFSPQEDSVYEANASACIEMCKKIISDNAKYEAGGETFGKECGEAFWMLYYLETDDNQADDYLQKSASYSYPKAVKEWSEKHAVSLVQTLQKATDSTTGCYYINADNLYSKIIRKTAAKDWLECAYPLCANDFSAENDSISISLKGLQKYFLVSDDFDKNLNDLLRLLQIVKDHSSKLNDKQIEFYIRGTEDEIYPFIDTALARLPICVPVHILDDDKMAARVLAKHPLFYPIRKLRNPNPSSLNFIVIGDTPCCEWLVREAFWMLTFRNTNIHTKITLVSPNPDKFETRLKFKCPDLNRGKLSGNFLEIEKVSCDFNTIDILTELENYMHGENTYMVIDTGSDTFNASLAIKIRETTIRQYIQFSDNELNKEFPVIAFRCQDPDIANLTRRSIVLNEAYGNKWFNNYALIPFGSADQDYSWNELTHNLFETLGLNIHLQYYKDPALLNPSAPNYDKAYRDAEKSFWARSYNRDSSIAVAMSIPYRLYQCSLTENNTPILPIGPNPLANKPLSILDDNAFFSKDAFTSYSIRFKEAGKKAAKASFNTRLKVDRDAKNSQCKGEYNSFTLCLKIAGEPIPEHFDEKFAGWQSAKYQLPTSTGSSAGYASELKGIFEKNGKLYQYTMEDDKNSELYQLAEWEHNRWIRFMISRGWTLAKIPDLKLYHREENLRQQLYIAKMHPCMVPYEEIYKIDKEWSTLIDKPYSFKENDIFAVQMTEQILDMEWTKMREKYLLPLDMEHSER